MTLNARARLRSGDVVKLKLDFFYSGHTSDRALTHRFLKSVRQSIQHRDERDRAATEKREIELEWNLRSTLIGSEA